MSFQFSRNPQNLATFWNRSGILQIASTATNASGPNLPATGSTTLMQKSITITNPNSKILITASASASRTGENNEDFTASLYRDSTDLGDGTPMVYLNDLNVSHFTLNYVDTPGATGTFNYSLKGKSHIGTGTAVFNQPNHLCTFILQEIL